ncbi:peptidase M48 [Flavipsychrobacter stenotrophus]|uniref:Peptidase M48 n=1 Tax=Flavipsychrobacter stenotrophus TaxID=2077091 RepID=A0A2S7SW49_9BACT|nr:M48 family metallopeptidase [Flavipsychrobacter stenotrophus]PQJ11172.1 peptidase M48 [Flavipsychrobacter stenotrophus]
MKKLYTYLSIIGLAAISTGIYSCHKNANGRNTLDLVDDATVMSLSASQYNEFIATNPPVTGTASAQMVQRVGARLTAAVQQYLADKGQSNLITNYNWEFNLVNNAEVNAWCLPGGKIVVYSGIMPLTLTDTDLAVVMGHEIAHAVLKHGNERMSQQLLLQYGGAALSVLLSSKPAETQQLFNAAFGLSSNLGILAFSRKQENEADETGLYFMASAGYNPNAAITFWQRMQAQGGGSSTPVLLSTHPSDESRIQHIRDLMPGAMAYYHP